MKKKLLIFIISLFIILCGILFGTIIGLEEYMTSGNISDIFENILVFGGASFVMSGIVFIFGMLYTYSHELW